MLKTIDLSEKQSLIYLDNSRFLQLVSGRRFGKTWLAMCDIIRWLINAKKNDTLLYLAPTYGMAKKILWNTLIDYIPRNILQGSPNISELCIRTIKGATLYLGGATHYDSFRGLQNLRKAWMDEAQDQPFEAWSEVVRAGVSDTMGSVWFLGTPKGMNSWFYDMTFDDNVTTYKYTTQEGRWVSGSEIELAKRQLDERTFKQEFMASFENYSGLVYYAFDGTQSTDKKFSLNADSTYLTWDFNVDPMSCIIVQKYGDVYHAVKEFIIQNSNTKDVCIMVSDYFVKNGFLGNVFITGDNTGHGLKTSASQSDYAIINEYFPQSAGNRKFTKVCKSQRDRVQATNSLFRPMIGEPRLLINKEECPKVTKDLRIVTWKQGGLSIDKKPGISDPSDALSYLPFNFEPVETSRRGGYQL